LRREHACQWAAGAHSQPRGRFSQFGLKSAESHCQVTSVALKDSKKNIEIHKETCFISRQNWLTVHNRYMNNTPKLFNSALGMVLVFTAVLGTSGAHAVTSPGSSCFTGGASSGSLAPRGVECWLVEKTVEVTATNSAAYLAGNAVVSDSRAADPGSERAMLQGHIFCFDSRGNTVFAIGATRNVWPGVGVAGVYPRGVFTPPNPGTYDCYMRVLQSTLSGSSPTEFQISGALAWTPAADGVTTAGPNQDGAWDPDPSSPSAAAELIPTESTDPQYGRLQWNSVPLGDINAVSMVNLTSCSFGTDMPPCVSIHGGRAALVHVTLNAWQTLPYSTYPCGGAGGANNKSISSDVGISDVIHHVNLPQVLTLTLSSSTACAARVVMRTSIQNSGTSSANVDVYVDAVNSLVAGWR
jgi:hypothetical protein